METEQDKANRLWEELLKQSPTNEDLRYIIEHVEALRKTAWQLLKKTKKEILNELLNL